MTGWILLNAALKGTIVLGAAWLMAIALRRNSAATRHLLWTAAAAAVLALPFLSVGLPALRLPHAQDFDNATGIVFRLMATVAPEAPMATPPPAGRTAVVRPASAAPVRSGLLPIVWSIGAAAFLLQMSIAYFAMWRRRRAARPFDRTGLGDLGIDPRVDLLEAPAGSMPMACGVLRPAIFLPSDARNWTDDRLRMVCLHELAHIRRGDLATHLLARTALSLHWWNPLAWIAWREFVKERERAADDLVLAAGARASDYAGHLLEVARSMQSSPATAWAAVAMARRSHLEGRLLAILDAGMKRGAAGRLAPLAAALAAVAMVAPFAALQGQSTPPPPELDATIRAALSQKNHDILDHAARVYMDLNKYEAAQTLLENALTIRGEIAGPQSAMYAAGLVKLGEVAEKRRQYADADQFYAKAVSLGDRPEVAPALFYLGIKAHLAGNFEAAADFFDRVLRVQPTGTIAGQSLTWMALMRRNAPDAEPLFQRALEAMDSNDPAAATTLELYASFLRLGQRDIEAEQFSSRARDLRRRLNLEQVQPTSNARRVGNGITAPALLHKVEVEYTQEARAAKFQGTVLLYVEIAPDGRAYNIRVARSLGLGLDEKAMEAVKQWTFRPGRDADGNPVTVAATIEVNFRLQ